MELMYHVVQVFVLVDQGGLMEWLRFSVRAWRRQDSGHLILADDALSFDRVVNDRCEPLAQGW